MSESQQQWGAVPGWEQQVGRIPVWQETAPWRYAPAAPLPVDLSNEPLPIVGRQYHEFWRAPKNRWWKALLALVLFWVAWFIITNVFAIIGVFIDAANGMHQRGGKVQLTPALFLANNLSLAAFIPLAMLLSWAFTGQRPKWLTSVEGGMRWKWLLRAACVIVPLWIFYMGGIQLLGGRDNLHSNSGTVLMIFGILLTTPLQCAGEEYAMRGITTRAVGSWIPNRTVGLIVSALASASVFTYLHNAQDIWLNIFYFCFALTGSYLTWRTGGLEAAIVLHVTNNLLAEATMPWTDFSNMFDRSAGTGSPLGLIQVFFCLVAIGLVELMMRNKRHRPRRETAPGNRAEDARLLQVQRPRVQVPSYAGGPGMAGPYGGAQPGQPQQGFAIPPSGQQGVAQPGSAQGFRSAEAQSADPYAQRAGTPSGQPDPYAQRAGAAYGQPDPYAQRAHAAQPSATTHDEPSASGQPSAAPYGQPSASTYGQGSEQSSQPWAPPSDRPSEGQQERRW